MNPSTHGPPKLIDEDGRRLVALESSIAQPGSRLGDGRSLVDGLIMEDHSGERAGPDTVELIIVRFKTPASSADTIAKPVATAGGNDRKMSDAPVCR